MLSPAPIKALPFAEKVLLVAFSVPKFSMPAAAVGSEVVGEGAIRDSQRRRLFNAVRSTLATLLEKVLLLTVPGFRRSKCLPPKRVLLLGEGAVADGQRSVVEKCRRLLPTGAVARRR